MTAIASLSRFMSYLNTVACGIISIDCSCVGEHNLLDELGGCCVLLGLLRLLLHLLLM